MVYLEKGNLLIRDCVLEDICAIKDHLRQEDKNEIWAATHKLPEESLLISYLISNKKFTIQLKTGEPIAVYGYCGSKKENKASIWLLGTDKITENKKSFYAISKPGISMILNEYPVLFNYVDARFDKSINWLKSLGAEIKEAAPFGLDDQPFHYFELRRK